MKKHNEGYTLALVLVVLTVLCILSSAVMTYAVKNLKNQQEAAQRDQNRYTAEDIETAVRLIEQAEKPFIFLTFLAFPRLKRWCWDRTSPKSAIVPSKAVQI